MSLFLEVWGSAFKLPDRWRERERERERERGRGVCVFFSVPLSTTSFIHAFIYFLPGFRSTLSKTVTLRRPLYEKYIWSHVLDLGIDFFLLRTKN